MFFHVSKSMHQRQFTKIAVERSAHRSILNTIRWLTTRTYQRPHLYNFHLSSIRYFDTNRICTMSHDYTILHIHVFLYFIIIRKRFFRNKLKEIDIGRKRKKKKLINDNFITILNNLIVNFFK